MGQHQSGPGYGEAAAAVAVAASPVASGTTQRATFKVKEWLAPGSSRYSWYVLCVLALASVVNFMDRMLLNVLVDPIKKEFGATDTQMGLLTGFVFVVIYATVGLGMARLADLKSRRNLLAIGMMIWSGMTLVSGFAKSFLGLAAARMGVAAAESVSGPATLGLIADYFPKEKRPLAMGINQATVYIGLFAGFIVAGVIGERYGWRTAFWVAALPGFVLAVLMLLTVREPVRGAMEAVGVNHGDASATFLQNIRWLVTRPAFMLISLATAFVAMQGYSYLIWSASYLRRVYELSGAEVGPLLALAISVPGMFGTFLGGVAGTWIQRRLGSPDRWTLRLCGLCMLIAVPLYLGFLMVPDLRVALVCLGAASFIAGLPTASGLACALSVVRVNMRSQAASLWTVLISVVGQGGGALIVGMVSDYFAASAGATSVRYGLVAALIGNVMAFVCYWVSSNLYERELKAL